MWKWIKKVWNTDWFSDDRKEKDKQTLSVIIENSKNQLDQSQLTQQIITSIVC